MLFVLGSLDTKWVLCTQKPGETAGGSVKVGPLEGCLSATGSGSFCIQNTTFKASDKVETAARDASIASYALIVIMVLAYFYTVLFSYSKTKLKKKVYARKELIYRILLVLAIVAACIVVYIMYKVKTDKDLNDNVKFLACEIKYGTGFLYHIGGIILLLPFLISSFS